MPDQLDRLKAALADRYTLERELGAGGMATVYLAEDPRHHRKVALKVLRPDLAATLGPDRFLREVTIAANLQHPHILPVYDSGEAGGFLFYVMPYVEGESLRDRLAKHGELPLSEAVRILRDVTDAMAAAHAKGVVHRDIKPENIMLSGRHALVADFGVAKAVSHATGRQALTTAGVALGTPTYMAPEQAAADPHTDHRADLYALGVTAYEMVTGLPPFVGPTAQAVLAAHVTQAPVPVTQRRATIPPLLAQLIMRCLEKKPADRPQSANELLTLLEAVLTPSGGITPTTTQPVVAMPPAGRRRWAALGGVTLVAAAAGLFAWKLLAPSHPTLRGDLVLVVPFENATGDAALDGVGDLLETAAKEGLQRTGLAEIRDSRTALAAVGRDRPRAEIVGPVNARRLAEEIGAGLVVVGRYLRVGDSLQLEASLIDLSEEIEPARIRAERVSLTASGAALEPLVQRIMGGLAVAQDPRWGVRYVPGLRAPSFDSYREYRTAVDFFDRRDFLSAAAGFARAVAVEPDFYLYTVRQAYALYNAGRCQDVDSVGAFLQERRAAISEYEGHYLDRVLAWCAGDYETALRAANAMARVAPRSIYARYLAARSATFVNRPREAVDGLRGLAGSVEEQAVDGSYTDLALALHLVGDYQEESRVADQWAADPRAVRPLAARSAQLQALAGGGDTVRLARILNAALTTRGSNPAELRATLLEAAQELEWHDRPGLARRVAEQALALGTDSPPAGRVRLLFMTDRLDEAGALADSMVEAGSDAEMARGLRGAIAAARGNRQLAQQDERWLAALPPGYGTFRVTMSRARIVAQLGNAAEAMQLLRQAYTQGASFQNFHHADTFLEPLRHDAAFQEFVRPKG